MITLEPKGIYLLDNDRIVVDDETLTPDALERQAREAGLGSLPAASLTPEAAGRGTLTHRILKSHNRSKDEDNLTIRFDSLASHDITYVGIVQTARASGLERFPVPFALTNCHNTLCAVGGTINEDDHRFGLSAARKYGGIYVPAHMAVIHQYVREAMTGCGAMILGSDSHTRYGALGTMGIGEGGGEIVKQLLEETYNIPRPEVIAVYLEGTPAPGVGPHDVALAIIGAVFESGFVKNKVMEFVGPGIAGLSVDFRNGIDVMTTETTCLSSIWRTDEAVRRFYGAHNREADFRTLEPEPLAYYQGLVRVDLCAVRPMIALPFHPSNVQAIDTLLENPGDILREVERNAESLLDNKRLRLSLTDKVEGGRVRVDQGIIAGCSGGLFENICAAADLIDDGTVGDGPFSLSVYPASQPVNLALMENGVMQRLMTQGVVTRTAFCGPCFGAGETPACGALSIRHTTRNFPNREGSKPGEGQLSSVALMDARSIAATARNGGYLTAADHSEAPGEGIPYRYRDEVYRKRVYNGFGAPRPEEELVMGPNIDDWPAMEPLPAHLLLQVVSVLTDPVTTTDELIPSGETSSYRSSPLRLAEFTLSRKDPGYVGRAKAVLALREKTASADSPASMPAEIADALGAIAGALDGRIDVDELKRSTGIGSVVCAVKPGDGSAREQAASCQKVLGTWANIVNEYATKRYRSNCVNWGMVPCVTDGDIAAFPLGGYVFIKDVQKAVEQGTMKLEAWLVEAGTVKPLNLSIPDLTDLDREILLAGNLINYQAGLR